MSSEIPTEFTPTNELEKLFMAAATDPTQRPRFYRELLDNEIFFLVKYDDLGVLIDTVYQNKQQVVPIFTSLALLENCARTMGLKEFKHEHNTAREMLPIVDGARVVLNPCAAYGKTFTPEEVRGMLDGSEMKRLKLIRIDTEAPLLISQPAKYPQELIDDLKASFAFHNSVQTAYLAQIHQPSKRQMPQLVIALETDENYDPVEAEDIAIEGLAEDEFLSFIQLRDDVISEYMLANSEPFFKRAVPGE